jgi:hypothetical protein
VVIGKQDPQTFVYLLDNSVYGSIVYGYIYILIYVYMYMMSDTYNNQNNGLWMLIDTYVYYILLYKHIYI